MAEQEHPLHAIFPLYKALFNRFCTMHDVPFEKREHVDFISFVSWLGSFDYSFASEIEGANPKMLESFRELISSARGLFFLHSMWPFVIFQDRRITSPLKEVRLSLAIHFDTGNSRVFEMSIQTANRPQIAAEAHVLAILDEAQRQVYIDLLSKSLEETCKAELPPQSGTVSIPLP